MRWLVSMVVMLAACQYDRATLHDEKLLRAIAQALGQDVFVAPPEGHAAVLAEACAAKNTIACALREHVVPPAKTWAVLEGVDLRAACELDPMACLVWTWRVTQQRPDGAYSQGMKDLDVNAGITRACRTLPRACVQVAYLSGMTSVAILTYKRTCEQGDASGCLSLARALHYGQGTARNPGEAQRRYREACQLGSLFSCSRLAREMLEGTIMRRDTVGAVALYEASCAGGDALGCRELGNHYAFDAEPPDPARGAAAYRRGCDLGDDASCVGWVDHGEPIDPGRAIALFEQACNAGVASGCTHLGSSYRKGEGVPKDAAKALEFFDRACRNDSAHGCSLAASLFQDGDLPPDDTKLVAYYEKACDGGYDIGCHNLGTHWHERSHPERARQAFAKACKLGNADSCEFAK